MEAISSGARKDWWVLPKGTKASNFAPADENLITHFIAMRS